jgi:hypothetical protein
MRFLLILLCMGMNACVLATEPAPVAAPEQNTEMHEAIQAPIQKAEKVEDQVIDGAEKQRAEIEAGGG